MADLQTIDTGWRPESSAHADLLDNFWIHMGGMFSQWSNQNGDVPLGATAAAWLQILEPMTTRQIRVGLKACLYSDSPHPPKPGQFRRMVFDNDRPEHRKLSPSRMIERKPAEDWVRDQNLAHIKMILGIEE